MRHATRVRHVLRSVLVLAVVLSWSPTATAGGADQDGGAPDIPLDIQNKLHFGPEVFAVERSTTASGERLRLRLDQGTSFTYLEGREIILELDGKVLEIAIQDHLVRVGKKHWCSSDDIACIVHAIRKHLKGLTSDHSAHGLAVLQHTLRSMQFGGPIAHVFHALTTMPQKHQDNHEDEDE